MLTPLTSSLGLPHCTMTKPSQRISPPRRCCHCDKQEEEEPFKHQCTRCIVPVYCSTTCQAADGHHQKDCFKVNILMSRVNPNFAEMDVPDPQSCQMLQLATNISVEMATKYNQPALLTKPFKLLDYILAATLKSRSRQETIATGGPSNMAMYCQFIFLNAYLKDDDAACCLIGQLWEAGLSCSNRTGVLKTCQLDSSVGFIYMLLKARVVGISAEQEHAFEVFSETGAVLQELHQVLPVIESYLLGGDVKWRDAQKQQLKETSRICFKSSEAALAGISAILDLNAEDGASSLRSSLPAAFPDKTPNCYWTLYQRAYDDEESLAGIKWLAEYEASSGREDRALYDACGDEK